MILKSTGQIVSYSGLSRQHRGHTYMGVFIPIKRKVGKQEHLQYVRRDHLAKEKV